MLKFFHNEKTAAKYFKLKKMNFKNDLDKYLTTPPEDGFTDWCERVCDEMSDEFYDKNEDWRMKYDGQCNTWLEKLFNKGRPVRWSYKNCCQYAAKVIERAFKLYKQ